MSGIETTQLTAAVVNVGQLTTKMYKEMKAQREQHAKDMQALSEHVEAVVSQATDLDTFRSEQLEAVEAVANIVKPIVGGQAALQTTVASVGERVNNQDEAFKKLVQVMSAMQQAIETIVQNQKESNERMTIIEETLVETASRVKTLGVQVSGMMTVKPATDEDFMTMMKMTDEMLKGE